VLGLLDMVQDACNEPVRNLPPGKFVAALDRQRPRDFFDTRERLDNEGIDDTLRRSFLVYLVSHSGPMHEVLTARRKDMTADFGRSFDASPKSPSRSRSLTRLARLSLRRSRATCRILTECF
jgi:hypothetical protein